MAFFKESAMCSAGSSNPRGPSRLNTGTGSAYGSVDVYFGPEMPEGQEKNWIQTVAGKGWFPIFRFYGPLQPLYEKTWKLNDIEQVK